jgi:hypothetical protein
VRQLMAKSLQIPATRLTSQDVQDLRLEILEKTKKKN